MLAFTVPSVLAESSPSGVSAHRAEMLAVWLCRDGVGGGPGDPCVHPCPESRVLVTMVQAVICPRGSPPRTSFQKALEQ